MLDVKKKFFAVMECSSKETVERWAEENEISVVGYEIGSIGEKYFYQLDVMKNADLTIDHKLASENVLLNGKREIGKVHYDYFLKVMVVRPEIRDR